MHQLMYLEIYMQKWCCQTEILNDRVAEGVPGRLTKTWASKMLALTIALILSCLCYGQESSSLERPNILLVVVDDLGFTDLGSFGGEINTPNIDKLALSGLRFTNFYAAATCSPTRTMLLSGTDHHIAGMGAMAESIAQNQKGKPGYEGYLNSRVVSVASLLKDAGYRTYMTGKWHLGLTEERSPAARGFERSFSLSEGGAGHLSDLPIVGPGHAKYRENGKPAKLPDNFYSTRFYADKLMSYLKEDATNDAPFFAYLAFTAPHWPLQAPKESIDKYRGFYDKGYEEVYNERLQRLKKMGLLAEGDREWKKFSSEQSWGDLSSTQRKIETKKMEIYAAMVDDVDSHLGRVLAYLDKIGKRENTVVVFMSDNGAEGHDLDYKWPSLKAWVAGCCDNSYENMGNADSYLWYGPDWGGVSSGPLRGFKGFASEGGVRVPAIIHYSKFKRQGEISHEVVSVMDLMPTILELAGTSHPGARYQGRPVVPMKGVSMVPYLQGEADKPHSDDYFLGWELYRKLAIRQGAWKLMLEPFPHGDGTWQLYDLSKDLSEQHDLASQRPEKLKSMTALWEKYQKEVGVIIADEISYY